MSKLKTYRVIVGKRDEVWTNESHEVKAKNMRIAKVIAKCRVPAYWNPIVREIAIMHQFPYPQASDMMLSTDQNRTL